MERNTTPENFKIKYPALNYDFSQISAREWVARYDGEHARYADLKDFCNKEKVSKDELESALKKYGIDPADLENVTFKNNFVYEDVIRAVMANYWHDTNKEKGAAESKKAIDQIIAKNDAQEKKENDQFLRARIAAEIKAEEAQKLNAEIERRFQAEKRRLAKA